MRYTGGESTAMALIGERWGVFPRLKRWVSEGRPVWGTCAGMILLSDSALMTKQGGQSLVGGLNVEVSDTYKGSGLPAEYGGFLGVEGTLAEEEIGNMFFSLV